jgi:hypothetical protein
VEVVEHENRWRSAQVVVDGGEDVVRLITLLQHRSGRRRQTVRKVLDRTEGPRRGQWVAGAPEHAFIAHPPFDERLDEGGLTGAGLTAHQDHASPTNARVVGPGLELTELVIALSEPHSSR